MRKINKIVIHHTATPEGRVVTMADIRQWHVKERGWSDIGYHYVIDLDGNVHNARPVQKQGAHVAGHNATSIGICYVGGMTYDMKRPKDTRTQEQKKALETLVLTLRHIWPEATVHGHNEFSSKACPSFQVKLESWAK